MLVQLRRVVYLLVLLQFCLSVHAGSGDAASTPVIKTPESDKSKQPEEVLKDDFPVVDDFKVTKDLLERRINDADAALAKGEGCLSQLAKVKTCEGDAALAVKANERVDELVKEIVEIKRVRKELSGRLGTTREKVTSTLKSTQEAMAEAVKAAKKAEESGSALRGAQVICKSFLGELNAANETVGQAVEGFGMFLVGNKTEDLPNEIKNLRERGTERLKELNDTIWEIYEVDMNATRCRFDAKEQLRVTKERADWAIEDLKKILEELPEQGLESDGIKGVVDGARQAIERQKEEIKSVPEEKWGSERVAADIAAAGKIRGEVNKTIEDANATLIQKREKEEEERNAKRAKEEQERKEAEEKAKREEEERLKAEEEAKKKKEEEAKRRAEEEKKKEEEERKAEEEKRAKEAKEKQREKARKENKDGSSSPALVHSPLLLLLLSVLGSILVC